FKVIDICLEVTGWSQHELLVAYGDFFVTWTLSAGYDKILRGMADNLNDFLNNLNSMHDFINHCSFNSEMLKPTFTCVIKDEHTLELHYISQRSGLNALVLGLVYRAAK
ncbi:hypothetical protein PMAYCL1PPCAC_14982, partial [Pristionchus mayeri]